METKTTEVKVSEFKEVTLMPCQRAGKKQKTALRSLQYGGSLDGGGQWAKLFRACLVALVTRQRQLPTAKDVGVVLEPTSAADARSRARGWFNDLCRKSQGKVVWNGRILRALGDEVDLMQ